MFEKPTYFIMASNERETDFISGAPKEDSLGKPRADFPQRGRQLRQSKPGRELMGGHGPDEQIDPALEFQLLKWMEPFEGALERLIEAAAHLQAPEVSQRGFSGAEGVSTCATLGEACQERQLLLGEGWFRDDGGFRQEHPAPVNDKAHMIVLSAEAQRLPDWLGQAERTIGFHMGGHNFRIQRRRSHCSFASLSCSTVSFIATENVAYPGRKSKQEAHP
jgi:hypothetical protein